MRLHSRWARASATSLISESASYAGGAAEGVDGDRGAFIPPLHRHPLSSSRAVAAVREKEILAFEATTKKGEHASKTGAELVPRMPQLAKPASIALREKYVK